MVSVSSPHNLPILNNFLNRSKRVKTKDPISKTVKMAILHKETRKPVAHRMADLKVVDKDMVVHKEAVLVRCHRKEWAAHKEMLQKVA